MIQTRKKIRNDRENSFYNSLFGYENHWTENV